MAMQSEVLQGTLDLLVLKTLDTMGPMHGFGIAQRIQQVSEDLLRLNAGRALSGVAASRVAGLDLLEMGCLGQQPEGEILFVDARRPKAARDGSRKLGPHVGNDQSHVEGDLARARVDESSCALFRRRELEADLDAELRSHIEMAVETNERRGMTPEAARREALRTFGGVEQAKERCRDQRGLPMLETTMQDLRFGVRLLRRVPARHFWRSSA